MEKIYKYIYISAYAINAVALIIYCFGVNETVSLWFPIIVFGIMTLILFVMGRLIQERFDNSLQLYLIAVSLMFLITAFIPPYGFWIIVTESITAVIIFLIAFLADDIFEK